MKKEESVNMKNDNKELNTIIGKGSVINGKVSIQNSIRIEGRIIGEVSSTGTVTIGSKGEVEGDIIAVDAIVGGKVKGSMKASEKIILEANSIFIGDMQTAKLTINEGAMFEGKCCMTEEKEEPTGKVKSEVKLVDENKSLKTPENNYSVKSNNEQKK